MVDDLRYRYKGEYLHEVREMDSVEACISERGCKLYV